MKRNTGTAGEVGPQPEHGRAQAAGDEAGLHGAGEQCLLEGAQAVVADQCRKDGRGREPKSHRRHLAQGQHDQRGPLRSMEDLQLGSFLDSAAPAQLSTPLGVFRAGTIE
jgi:hypothetical protein